MVAPVTGPFITSTGTSQWTEYVVSYRQQRPYTLTTEYRHEWTGGSTRSVHSDPSVSYDNTVGYTNFNPETDSDLGWQRQYDAAYSQAYERLKNAVGDNAGWAENLAQFGKTMESTNDRLGQLVRFTTALKRRNFRAAARALRSPKPDRVTLKKSFASNFLEWEYGWSPLLKDISSSLKILTETDFGSHKVRGSASASGSYFNRTSGTQLQGTWFQVDSKGFELKVRVFALAQIVNPNLYLAGSMGIIDPALPWKLVPFSFVVDWFVNVEQVISSLTPFLGVSLTRQGVSHFTTGRYSSNYVGEAYRYFSLPFGYYSTVLDNTSTNATAKFYKRVPGIPSPSLVVKPFKGFSPERGAQALSLIVANLVHH